MTIEDLFDIGYDEKLDPELVELAHSSLGAVAEGWWAAGFLSEAVLVPESADAQRKLLALVGRAA